MGAIQQVLLGYGGVTSAYSPWDVSSLPANVTASDGNFKLTRSGGTNSTRIVAHPVTRTTGKFALRFDLSGATGPAPAVGIRNGATGTFLGQTAAGWGWWIDSSGASDIAYNNNAGSTYSVGNHPGELMMEVDATTGKLYLGFSGTWANSGNPAAGTGAVYTNLSGTLALVADMYYVGAIKLKVPADFITAASSGFTPGWPD